jgi:hypothetical protein
MRVIAQFDIQGGKHIFLHFVIWYIILTMSFVTFFFGITAGMYLHLFSHALQIAVICVWFALYETIVRLDGWFPKLGTSMLVLKRVSSGGRMIEIVDLIAYVMFVAFVASFVTLLMRYSFAYNGDGTVNPPWTSIFG